MSNTTHFNAVTQREIKAANLGELTRTMTTRRFAEACWATSEQWKKAGRPVRSGEIGIALTGQVTGFTWRVFNVAQTEGEGGAEASRAPAPVAPRPPAATAHRQRRATRAPESKKFVKSGARSAPADTSATVSVKASDLREALEWTRRAMSTEETRYYLCGVYFAPISTRELELVATDGTRMHAQRLVCSWQKGPAGPGFIMRPETIRALIKAIANRPRDVSITIDGDSISADVHGGDTVTGTAIPGTFPDYPRVVPRDCCAPFTLSGKDIFAACDQAIDGAKATPGRRGPVAVAVDAAGVHAHSLAPQHAYHNAKLLRDVARMADVITVALAKGGPREGLQPTHFNNGTRWALLMPMRDEPTKPAPAQPHATPGDVPAEATPAPVDNVVTLRTAAPPPPAAQPKPMTWRERWVATFGPRAQQ